MQDWDSYNFISPIPGFEGDIPIPAILISTRDPGVESSEDPSAGPSASASSTRACKRKAPIDPSPTKKAKKTTGKPSGGIKITGTKQKAPTSTPPSGIPKGIPILRSKRYTYLKYPLSPFVVNPQTSMQSASKISLWPLLQRIFHPRASPQRWTSPRVLLLEKPFQRCRIHRAQRTSMFPLVPQVIRLPHLPLTRNVMPPINLQGQIPPCVKKHPQ
jgi:hypothetical protein